MNAPHDPVSTRPAMIGEDELPPAHPGFADLVRPLERQALLEFLDGLRIGHTTYDHAPVFTVAESADLKTSIPAAPTKNLFLKAKAKGAAASPVVLASVHADTRAALGPLAKRLGLGRFSFGTPELLHEALGVTPGSVTLFALANDRPRRVACVIDARLLDADHVGFHPLRNDATTVIQASDMVTFVEATGRPAHIIDFAALARQG